MAGEPQGAEVEKGILFLKLERRTGGECEAVQKALKKAAETKRLTLSGKLKP